jgi:hypothetical protein
MPWPNRITKAAAFRSQFHPDWISLQFVPYGFNDKGLVWNLWNHLSRVIGDCRLHIMFHELWIGEGACASFKEKVVGVLQRRFILLMTRKLRPSVVSTRNGAYIAMIERHNIAASRLPLFGHIPIVERPEHDWLFGRCYDSGLDVTPANRSEFWIFGIFAALHPTWPPEPLFSRLNDAAARHGKRVILSSIGRLGGGERLWESLAHDYGRRFTFVTLGEQPVQRVSEYLQWIDFGLATSPWALIEKSSSVAAMVEHGLPVIVNRDDVRFDGCDMHPPARNSQLFKIGADLTEKLPRLRRGQHRSVLPQVAEQFLTHLRKSEEADVAESGFPAALLPRA